MIGLKLSEETNDLFIDEDGKLGVIADNEKWEQLRMVIQSSLRTFAGEVMTDVSTGCDWINIFQMRDTKARLGRRIEKEVRDKAFEAAMGWEGFNGEVEFVSILLDGETRLAKLVIKYDGREIVV